ncbi:MAG: patatin-like phospholipase family protein [Arcobacter sp.]|nr:patatin-like phospholipase family protein [Arcobacter sp.]
MKTKLGVVLSGGGAKGAYEAGFLKALSEFNIQPDAIAGTSIGALNGSLYSANVHTRKLLFWLINMERFGKNTCSSSR